MFTPPATLTSPTAPFNSSAAAAALFPSTSFPSSLPAPTTKGSNTPTVSTTPTASNIHGSAPVWPARPSASSAVLRSGESATATAAATRGRFSYRSDDARRVAVLDRNLTDALRISWEDSVVRCANGGSPSSDVGPSSADENAAAAAALRSQNEFNRAQVHCIEQNLKVARAAEELLALDSLNAVRTAMLDETELLVSELEGLIAAVEIDATALAKDSSAILLQAALNGDAGGSAEQRKLWRENKAAFHKAYEAHCARLTSVRHRLAAVREATFSAGFDE